MQSLQVKFSALVVALLVTACVGLAVLATRHERHALEVEVEKRGRALASNLAGAAKEPLLAIEAGGAFSPELSLDKLIQDIGDREGVVAVRLLDRDGRVLASSDPGQRGQRRESLAGHPKATDGVWTGRESTRLQVAAPVIFQDVLIGEAQVELDLRMLVDPVVANNAQQLTAVALVVVVVGVLAGIGFVALLVGPLRRLREGVERVTKGEFTVRVPPTSNDEIGELTRAFNDMGDWLQQKETIEQAFGRYVDQHVLDELLKSDTTDEKQAGIEREVTVLFADIRQFTRLSEGMKANDVVNLLNECFQLMSDLILEAGGTIDKFIGDSVMAYFGAPPRLRADHALCAVGAAIEIARAVERRNARLAASGNGGVAISVGIGIHTGVVVVGNIGSDKRSDFTAIGDAVNVAHRLEKLARPGEILVSEAVQRQARGAARLRFEGERQLSGREEPVHVYSVDLGPLAGAGVEDVAGRP